MSGLFTTKPGLLPSLCSCVQAHTGNIMCSELRIRIVTVGVHFAPAPQKPAAKSHEVMLTFSALHSVLTESIRADLYQDCCASWPVAAQGFNPFSSCSLENVSFQSKEERAASPSPAGAHEQAACNKSIKVGRWVCVVSMPQQASAGFCRE